jgi:glycosyltransferase involved in cell wall biosynthesis
VIPDQAPRDRSVVAAARPLTVLHVDTERGWRGGQRQALWLAEGLVRAGYRSIVAARPGEPLAERAAVVGLRVVPIAPFFAMDPLAVIALRRTIAAAHADVLHAHTSHAVALGALASLGSPVRLVLTRRVDYRLSANPITGWKYRRADGVIAISEAVKRALVESGVPRERIEIIPSGVDLDRSVAPATPATLAELGVPSGAPLVVQVAALVTHKDPLTFVRAIAAARRAVPALHAVMVGAGHLRGAVEAERAALGLDDSLHLAGYRTDADAILAAADVVTLSSEEEGLGTVLLDALAFGRPVAATAGGGIPEIVQDGVTGLLAPVGDAEALGAAIARLLSDRELAARLAAGGRERAMHFSIARTVERTAQVYERVVRGSRFPA